MVFCLRIMLPPQALPVRFLGHKRPRYHCVAPQRGPPNAYQRLLPLQRWPLTASVKFDQQTDIQTITVWGGVEEIPIPLLSCLSVCGYRALTLDDSPLPHTLTLRVGVRGVSVLCSLCVCVCLVVCVCVCVCVCLTHSHSLTTTHSLPLISHSFPLSSYLTSFSLTFYSLHMCSVHVCVCVCGFVPSWSQPHSLSHTRPLSLTLLHTYSQSLTYTTTITPTHSHSNPLTHPTHLYTLCACLVRVCVCGVCVCVGPFPSSTLGSPTGASSSLRWIICCNVPPLPNVLGSKESTK